MAAGTATDEEGTASSNRTFMELKFEKPFNLHILSYVLIAPLWN